MKTNTNRKRGFTLVELLVVIVIIASLAALSAPMIMGQIKKANKAEAISNSKQIGLALFEFDSDYGSYPDKDTAADVTLAFPNADVKDEKFMTEQIFDIADEVQSYINKSYNYFSSKFLNIHGDHRFEIKQEMIAKAAFWVTKKRYGQWIINDSGTPCEKLDVKGLDIVRSSFPKSFQKLMKDVMIDILKGKTEEEISDYVLDNRSKLITGDPHSSVYISNRVDLKQPASSLKVLVSAYRPAEADFRVLYKLYKTDSSEVDQSFVLFPGYDNLKDTDGDGFGDLVIDSSKNSGRSDAFVRPSNAGEFLEYQFTADNLDIFTGFAIKIVISSTNESKSPEFKDLRVIALA